MEPCFKRMLQWRQTEVRRNVLTILYLHYLLSPNGEKISTTNANFAHKSFIEKEFSYGKDAKRRKHGWLVKVNITKITHQLMTKLEGELRMLRSINVSMRPQTSWSYLVKMLATSCRVTCTYSEAWQLDCLLDVLVTMLLSYLKMQLKTTRFK